jgi:hypothetical protein
VCLLSCDILALGFHITFCLSVVLIVSRLDKKRRVHRVWFGFDFMFALSLVSLMHVFLLIHQMCI